MPLPHLSLWTHCLSLLGSLCWGSFLGSIASPFEIAGLSFASKDHHHGDPGGPQVLEYSHQTVTQYQMWCPKWRLMQVYCWAPSRSIEAGSRIRIRNSCEFILHLVVLLHVNHSGHFLHRHISYLPVWELRALCW